VVSRVRRVERRAQLWE